VDQQGKLVVCDWQLGAESKTDLGEISRGKAFKDEKLETDLDWVEITDAIGKKQVVVRGWNPTNDVELLLAIPDIHLDWYYKAQGSARDFPRIRSLFPATFRHGSGKTNLRR